MEARNQRGGAVVVEDQKQIEILGDRGLDGVQEPAELPASMPSVAIANNLAGLDIQCCEQGRHAVTRVVTEAALSLPGTPWQTRLPSVRGLTLGLFVHAHYHRL